LLNLKNLDPLRPSLSFLSKNQKFLVKSNITYSYMFKGEQIKKDLINLIKNISLVSLLKIYLFKNKLATDNLFNNSNKNKFINVQLYKYDFEFIISLKFISIKNKKNKTVFTHKVIYQLNLINPTINSKFKDFIKLNKLSKVSNNNKFNSIAVLKRTFLLKTVFPNHKIYNIYTLILQKIIKNL
jgi:hypothetical protein